MTTFWYRKYDRPFASSVFQWWVCKIGSYTIGIPRWELFLYAKVYNFLFSWANHQWKKIEK